MKNTVVILILWMFSFPSYTQICTYTAIDSNSNVDYYCKGTLQINGKINDTSKVKLISEDGDVVITGKIDSGSNVTIKAKRGSVTIRKKIDGDAVIRIVCRGDIIIEGKIAGGANCDFYTETGAIKISDLVDNKRTVIRYHSILPPDWGSSIAITPEAY